MNHPDKIISSFEAGRGQRIAVPNHNPHSIHYRIELGTAGSIAFTVHHGAEFVITTGDATVNIYIEDTTPAGIKSV